MKLLSFVLTVSLSLVFLLDARAQSGVTYIYDELGRLVGVVDAAGETVTYTYDEVGNLLSTSRRSSALLSIIEFTPNRGVAGATVTIYGTAFSTTASENVVAFNGVAATVTSSSATRIITTVPSGATTGAITITTPSASATSSTAFIVGSTPQQSVPQPPTITDFTPTIGLAGTPVTVNGNGFEAVTTDNKLTFGGTQSGIDSATTTTINTTAPKGGSGRISVTTPHGTALSSSDFFVPPPPYKVEDVRYTGRISYRTPTVVNSAAANTVSMMIFDGKAGDRISMHMSDWTSAFDIRIYQPDEKILASDQVNSYRGSKAFLDTKVLPLTGTYTILVTTAAAGPNHLTLKLYDVPPDVTGTLTPGRYVYVDVQTPGQNGELTFNGIAGQKVVVIMEDNTMPSGTSGLVMSETRRVVNQSSLPPPVPGGGSTTVGYVYARALELPPGETLPTTGPMIIRVDPTSDSIGHVKVTLYLQPPDASLPITPGGAPVTVTSVPHESTPMVVATSSGGSGGNSTTTVINHTTPPPNGPGTNWWLVFNGTAGQKVSLSISDVTIPGDTYVSWNKPDGTYLLGRSSFGVSGGFIDTLTLPVTGTYKIFVDPSNNSTGKATFKLHDVPPDAAGTISSGALETRTITIPGQNLALTFSGTQGQQVSLQVNEITIPGTTVVSLRKPDGSTLTSRGFSVNGGFIEPLPLPVSGTYTVYVDASAANLGSITLQLGGQTSSGGTNRMELASSVSVQRGISAGSDVALAPAVSVRREDGQAQTLVLSSSVSIKRGSATGLSDVGAAPVSVRRGSVAGASELMSAQVSVRRGSASGAVESAAASVSVNTGAYITSLSPVTITRGTTATLTITGVNLTGATAVKFVTANGIIDANIIITNIVVNNDGTTLTATITTGATAALGRQLVVVTTANGSSPAFDLESNAIQVSQ